VEVDWVEFIDTVKELSPTLAKRAALEL